VAEPSDAAKPNTEKPLAEQSGPVDALTQIAAGEQSRADEPPVPPEQDALDLKTRSDEPPTFQVEITDEERAVLLGSYHVSADTYALKSVDQQPGETTAEEVADAEFADVEIVDEDTLDNETLDNDTGDHETSDDATAVAESVDDDETAEAITGHPESVEPHDLVRAEADATPPEEAPEGEPENSIGDESAEEQASRGTSPEATVEPAAEVEPRLAGEERALIEVSEPELDERAEDQWWDDGGPVTSQSVEELFAACDDAFEELDKLEAEETATEEEVSQEDAAQENVGEEHASAGGTGGPPVALRQNSAKPRNRAPKNLKPNSPTRWML